MFTRRGETRPTPPLPEPRLADSQLHHEILQARAAAAPPPVNGIEIAAMPPPPAAAVSAAPPAVETAPTARSVIGEDLSIEGQSIAIRCRGALEINGKIQAELHSQKLVVGQSGQVEGTIAADAIDVHGRVSGTILGTRVVLHSSAEVEGDIHAMSLTISDGASFEGRSRKVTDAAAIAPRLEPGSPSLVDDQSVPLPRPVTALMPSPATAH